MAQNLLHVMRICSAVILRYLDAGFEPLCPRREFRCICLMLLFRLLMRAPKRRIFPSKWTDTLRHGVRDASLNPYLHSFDSPVATEEEWPSLLKG